MSDDDECTHEVSEMGLCVACGDELEYDDDYAPSIRAASQMSGCQNRGWYHDGSEQQEAFAMGRAPKPCPHHSGGTA